MRSVSPVPKENVTGVGVGEKISSGKHTGVWAVKFFVRLKFPEAQLEIKHRLPKFIGGLPVDVEETGLFRPFAPPATKPIKEDATLNPRTMMRPSQPGCSVGFNNPDPKFTVAGTFGALVRDETNSYILSNNHVLADEGRLPPGSPIFQPGLLDGGDPDTDQIAELTKTVALDVEGPVYGFEIWLEAVPPRWTSAPSRRRRKSRNRAAWRIRSAICRYICGSREIGENRCRGAPSA